MMVVQVAAVTLGVIALCVLVLAGLAVRHALRREAGRLASARAELAVLAERAARLEAAQGEAEAVRAAVADQRADLARRFSDLAAAQTRLDREAAARSEAREARLARALQGLASARRRDAQTTEALGARLAALEARAADMAALATRLDAVERAQRVAADAPPACLAAPCPGGDTLQHRLAPVPAPAHSAAAQDPDHGVPTRAISVLGP